MKKSSFFDKEYLRRVAVYMGTALLSVGIILYLFYHITSEMRDDVTTLYMKETTVADNILCDAYILRDEVPIYADAGASGVPAPMVTDGGKVGIRDKVADLYTEYNPAVTDQIRVLEDQINFYKRSAAQNSSGGTVVVDGDIAEDVTALCRAAASGDAVSAVGCRDKLLTDMRRREVIAGLVDNYDERISALQREIASLRSSLGASLGSVYTPEAGYYFSGTDGYEGILTSKNIDALTYSAAMEMLNAQPQTQTRLTAGKLVRNYRWFIACPMRTDEALSLQVGEAYTVTLSRNTLSPVEMSLYRVLQDGDDSIALFRCDRIPEGYDFTRAQSAAVTVTERQAFKVPITAVRQYGGTEGVYVLDQVTVSFRRIEILREENGYYLCIPGLEEEDGQDPWLRENDVVIVTGTGLKVGMTYAPKKN